jgi:hypothetical protein
MASYLIHIDFRRFAEILPGGATNEDEYQAPADCWYRNWNA